MTTTKAWNDQMITDGGVAIASIDRVDGDGTAWVCVRAKHIPILPTTTITSAQVSRAVELSTPAVVAFVDGGTHAIILGFLSSAAIPRQTAANELVDLTVDGRRAVITAQDEIVLRCGKSSITLTKAGKVLIRGAYLSSRSSGTNRIKGGSVQIN